MNASVVIIPPDFEMRFMLEKLLRSDRVQLESVEIPLPCVWVNTFTALAVIPQPQIMESTMLGASILSRTYYPHSGGPVLK